MPDFVRLARVGRARLFRDQSGAGAVEFAVVSFLLVLFLLNGLEFARYSFQKMQVDNAANAAVMSVWKTCDRSKLPAQTNCSGRDAAILAGLQSTGLGAAITQSGTPDEGYYCVNSGSGQLVKVAAVTAAKPSDCSSQGDTTHAPGDYIMITASLPYSPMFMGVGFANFLPATIQSTGYLRLS